MTAFITIASRRSYDSAQHAYRSKVDAATRSRRNRMVALILAVIAVALYVGIGMRWNTH